MCRLYTGFFTRLDTRFSRWFLCGLYCRQCFFISFWSTSKKSYIPKINNLEYELTFLARRRRNFLRCKCNFDSFPLIFDNLHQYFGQFFSWPKKNWCMPKKIDVCPASRFWSTSFFKILMYIYKKTLMGTQIRNSRFATFDFLKND